MAQGKPLARDFDALEAEIAMTLAESSFPLEKRTTYQKRLEAIRSKMGEQRSQWS